LIIAASAIALELGIITETTNSALILVAVATCTFSPVLFTWLVGAAELEPRQGIILVGKSREALFLAQRLTLSGEAVTCVPGGGRGQKAMGETGCRLIKGAPDDEQVLQRAGAEQAAALMALLDDPEQLLATCRLARERFKLPRVVAVAEQPELVQALRKAGAQVIEPVFATALAMEGSLHFASIFQVLEDVSYGVELTSVPLRNRVLAGRPLGGVRLPRGVRVLGIKRRAKALALDVDTILEVGDIVVLAGSPEPLLRARQRFGG
jgi:Trk K+ transport system NAD-binding subunit